MFKRLVFTAFGLLFSTNSIAGSHFVEPQKFIRDDGSRILYAHDRSEAGLGLYSMTPTGKDVKVLIKPSVRRRGDYEAAVSHDGKTMAFTTYRYGGWKIAISNIDGSNVRRVTMDPQYAYDPHFSPDGKSLVYRRVVPSGRAYYEGQADIYRINIDGSGNKNLTNTGKDGDRKAAFSPDGQTVVYDSFKNNDGKALWIMMMNPDGSNLHRVKSGSELMFAPSWSPDGQWLAHLRADDDDYVDVWVMRLDGSEARNLTNSRKRGLKPVGEKIRHWQYDTNWSINGEYITFVSNYADQDNIDIYAVDVKGKHIARLTSHKDDDLHPYAFKVR
ncbi:MAG: PD40 domain-containing protein [Algicola sp.]|nr:PD40 domain-containing protein [Algicola sp.]